jgi:hypothetical protein
MPFPATTKASCGAELPVVYLGTDATTTLLKVPMLNYTRYVVLSLPKRSWVVPYVSAAFVG